MNLSEFIGAILDSEPKDWHQDGSGGPVYLSSVESILKNNHLVSIDGKGHDSRAVLASDINISMYWGMTENDCFVEPWTNGFSDPKASSFFLDLNYSGSIVHREIVVSVDGGRCYLPLPNAGKLSVPQGRVDLIRLLQNIGGTSADFDDYFNKANLSETQDPWP